MSIGTTLGAMVMAAAVLASQIGRAEELLVIANPAVGVEGPLSRSELAAIYLLRSTNWPDGTHIVPVNREASSALRSLFTARVLQQDNATLAIYWNEMHYKGKLPPVVQESEQSVLAFVQKVPGAIGYISAGIEPSNVKVLGHVR